MGNPLGTLESIRTFLAFAILVSQFLVMASMWIDKAKAPEKSQDIRITKLEHDIEDLKDRFLHDDKRIQSLEEGNVVTQEALLALMSHALNGNDREALIEAKSNLERYLTHKGVKMTS